ncbi:DUF4367 domain-containing protein [Paenibacillus hodogayensis]|uniref:DUF4367 domain-containing protein n=1 Tax=Paenibacillus hodogayensis TaxID=279208 RepID=A0ABV5VS87_9BACL
MRRVTWMLAIVMCVALVAAGCGTRNAEQVVKDLDHVIGKLDSYQGSGTMTLQTGQQAQEYSVDVSYQNPHYYRIALTNEAKDITQIVLRNDEGVFVLTPHLNKMFRFQSDWPENSGQVYLYQSLVQSIVMDNERQFAEEKDAYVFDVAANYQNGLLARQKIWLNKKDYAPKQVQVADENNNVMVSVKFTQFEFGKKFDKDSFDMQRNMTSWNLQTMPTSVKAADAGKLGAVNGATTPSGTKGTETGKETPAAKPTGAAATGTPSTGSTAQGTTGAQHQQQGTPTDKATAAAAQSFGIVEPSYVPQGVKKQELKEVKLGEEKAILFRYSGTYNYTLVESMPQAKTVTSLNGTILDLGYTIGVVTGEEKGLRTLTWTYDGMDYRLSTGDLSPTEMIRIAQSVQGQVGK